jgi:hypothetical protein
MSFAATLRPFVKLRAGKAQGDAAHRIATLEKGQTRVAHRGTVGLTLTS